MAFDTPILFLVFNRPSTTSKVFEQIRAMKPRYLYISGDGPRKNVVSDAENCVRVREICNGVDWACEVKTLYRTENLGCKAAVSSAIDWFFSNVDEGIILEDDILPSSDFFEFCESMLARYRDNEMIAHISGFNVLGSWRNRKQSWHFSHFGMIWGWATWKRSWKKYDVGMKTWSDSSVQQRILQTYFPRRYRAARKLLYDNLYSGKIDTWDYQWTFARLLMEGYSVIPSVNLTMNIGFSEDATHTSSAPDWLPKTYLPLSFPLVPPKKIEIDKEYDKKHLKIAFSDNESTMLQVLKSRVLNLTRVLTNRLNR